MLSPGSVGQRATNPRAAFAILDLQAMTWQFERVEYRINFNGRCGVPSAAETGRPIKLWDVKKSVMREFFETYFRT